VLVGLGRSEVRLKWGRGEFDDITSYWSLEGPWRDKKINNDLSTGGDLGVVVGEA
jgi:hypothetical protein